MMRKV